MSSLDQLETNRLLPFNVKWVDRVRPLPDRPMKTVSTALRPKERRFETADEDKRRLRIAAP
jgi:hypothetical protein